MFKRKRVKVQFDITIKSVEWASGYAKMANKPFRVEWKERKVLRRCGRRWIRIVCLTLSPSAERD